MTQRLSKVLVMALVAALAIGAASATFVAAAEPSFGGELVIGTTADVGNFNTLVSNSVTDKWILNLMYPPLMILNEAGEKVPYMAKSWHYEEEGLKAVFELRDDIQWDDGTPFTAADVKFTADQLKFGNIGLVGSMLSDVESVETDGDHRVVFNLSQPYGPFLTSVGFWIRVVPKHIWETKGDLEEFANDVDPVGVGPFKLVDYQKGQYYRLAKVEHFPLAPAGSAYLDGVIFRVFPDMNTMLLALRKGEIDGIANPVPSASLADLERERDIAVVQTPSLGYHHITYNMENPHLAKKEVRQALIRATNKDAIRTVVLRGNALALQTVVSPVLGDWYDETVADFPFDPEAAKAQLQAAGYTMGRDGYFNDLTFRMIYDSGNANIARWVTMVAFDAAEAGIRIELDGMERNTFLAKANARDFDLYAGGWGTMDEPSDYFSLLFEEGSFINYNNVSDPVLDAMMHTARYSTDPAEVAAAVSEIQHYVQDQAYVNTLYVEMYNLAYRTDKFEGFGLYPSDLGGFVDPQSLMGVYKKN